MSTVLPSHLHGAHRHDHSTSLADLTILCMLTSAKPPSRAVPRRRQVLDRRPQMDPLIIETAAAGGPHITRNHFLHEYYPHSTPYYRCDLDGENCKPVKASPRSSPYKSQQGPRRLQLAKERGQSSGRLELIINDNISNIPTVPSTPSDSLHSPKLEPITASSKRPRRPSTSDPNPIAILRSSVSPTSTFTPLHAVDTKSASPVQVSSTRPPPLQVVCHARTRIPTPHGHLWLHLYRNNCDDKEHLAFVVDRAQIEGTGQPSWWLRSLSLDAEWRQGETEMERIVRGAYFGRLGSGDGQAVASIPRSALQSVAEESSESSLPPPALVRIHSECFTGETLGSQRCDCGEQLDEALRLLATTAPYRGVVVYMRQEGRGIGLLSKMRAYNLQDLGHDTVTANLLLGHGADQRSYEVAGGILRDLGIQDLRLLTNNPDKIESVEREGLRVVERVGMAPRQWALGNSKKSTCKAEREAQRKAARGQKHQGETGYEDTNTDSEEDEGETEAFKRRAGVGMIGGSVTRSAELDKYLRTKVERMRHMICIPSAPSLAPTSAPLSQTP